LFGRGDAAKSLLAGVIGPFLFARRVFLVDIVSQVHLLLQTHDSALGLISDTEHLEVLISIVLLFKDIIFHMLTLVFVSNFHDIHIMRVLLELLVRDCLGLLLDLGVSGLGILLFGVLLARLVVHISANQEQAKEEESNSCEDHDDDSGAVRSLNDSD